MDVAKKILNIQEKTDKIWQLSQSGVTKMQIKMWNQGQPLSFVFRQIHFRKTKHRSKKNGNKGKTGWQQGQSRVQQEGNQNEKSGRPVIDSPAKFAWKLGSCRNYRPAINQRIMSQTRTRVVQTCQSFLDSFAGIFQSFARMGKTIFHAVLYNNKAYNTTCYTISLPSNSKKNLLTYRSYVTIAKGFRSWLYSVRSKHQGNLLKKIHWLE